MNKGTRSVISSLAAMILVMCPACLTESNLFAQDEKSSSGKATQDATSELTNGLLDLLEEPEPAGKKAESTTEQPPNILPSDVGLQGEDLGEQSEDPLQAVRQSMVIAAEFLNRGVTGKSTQMLQGDIVERLDDLILQVEQAQNDQQRSESNKQDSSQESSQEQEQQSQQSTTQEQDSENESSEQKREPSPGEQGDRLPVELQLADPRKLQEEVWGQLPERIRKQMRSTMVEQFLPTYRDQIQAYFEALLQEKL